MAFRSAPIVDISSGGHPPHSNGTGELGVDAAGTFGFRRGVHVYSRGYGRDRCTLPQQRTAVAPHFLLCTLYC